ncbi:hypothetical protein JW766_06025 [Candidatus Dojkabacteria bacterium]|nr:hypothetical protein [Candidatus Dojkabacteria bacterium]
MAKQLDNLQDSFKDARPVPKEQLSVGQVADVSSTSVDQGGVPVQTGSRVQNEPSQVEPTVGQPIIQQTVSPTGKAQEAQPQMSTGPATNMEAGSVQEIGSDKKGGGIKCNKTTCCIGSCVIGIVFIISLVLLSIFAAPFIADVLNSLINPDVEVPEVQSVSLEDLESRIQSIVQMGESDRLEVSEDEFNSLLRKNLEEAGTQESTDLRIDFKKDKSYLYLKFMDWMPWAIIETASDERGSLQVNRIKLGPIDVSDIAEQQMETQTDSNGIDMTTLLSSYIFKDEDNVVIEAIYFEDDKMIIVIEVDTEMVEE